MLPLIAMLVAAAASSYAQNRSVKAQQEEMNRRSQEERGRQRILQEQADQERLRQAARYNPEEQQRQTENAAQVREERLSVPAQAPPTDYTPTTAAAPTEVKTDIARRMADAATKGRMEASRLAQLQAFGDTSLANQFSENRAREGIRQIADFSRGSSKILPYELEAAQNKGQNWQRASELAGMISKAAGAYAMGGGGAAGAAGAAGSNAAQGFKAPAPRGGSIWGY